jgi:hypothetical protein
LTWLMLRKVASSNLRGREHVRTQTRNCGQRTNTREWQCYSVVKEAKEAMGGEANVRKQRMRILDSIASIQEFKRSSSHARHCTALYDMLGRLAVAAEGGRKLAPAACRHRGISGSCASAWRSQRILPCTRRVHFTKTSRVRCSSQGCKFHGVAIARASREDVPGMDTGKRYRDF